MLWQWMPWKFFIGRAARAYGLIDPAQLLARLRGFSQPSEVQEPIELLRAGVVFQARGLINSRVIQYNLDWIWPYWVNRQYSPEDSSFMPRSFSFGHVNLTQRSWTAVGRHDLPLYAIVDPRGLVTPLHDGWSLDFWVIDCNGKAMVPAREKKAEQRVGLSPQFSVYTRIQKTGVFFESEVVMRKQEQTPVVSINLEGQFDGGGWLVASVRPYNPEGISFIERIRFEPDSQSMIVNGKTQIAMNQAPASVAFSNYRGGDVFHRISVPEQAGTKTDVHCPLGLATGAVAFNLPKNKPKTINFQIPLEKELHREVSLSIGLSREESEPTGGDTCRAVIPDATYQFLFDNAVHTLMMLSAGDIVPGPYTYKRFWFRDGCLMLHALLCLNRMRRCRRQLRGFFHRQKKDGYFQSQEGEWDSNGQVLWILGRYRELSAQPLPRKWTGAILKAARWILAKRTSRTSGKAHAGLLPAGFSAEHLGPNDFYFWDDFWAVAGLKSAAELMAEAVSDEIGKDLAAAADQFEKDLFDRIEAIDGRQSRGGIPASPYRRMDAGAIGSMVADYPLQLTPSGDERIMATLEHLMGNHFFHGGFFQDMIHSGVNAYLTLDLAQTLLRIGDDRFYDLVETVAALASSTGNWPEAVHPFSGGGCMGDGQHGWAAAEWVMMIRNMFIREEGRRLVIGSGLLPHWIKNKEITYMAFGPTATPHGPVFVEIRTENGQSVLRLDGELHRLQPAQVDVKIPGYKPMEDVDTSRGIRLVPDPAT